MMALKSKKNPIFSQPYFYKFFRKLRPKRIHKIGPRIPMTNEKMLGRLKGLLQEFVKKSRQQPN
jgi:hypothetical protein